MHGPRDQVRTSSCLLLKPDPVPIFRQVLTFRRLENLVVENIAAILPDPRGRFSPRTFQAGFARIWLPPCPTPRGPPRRPTLRAAQAALVATIGELKLIKASPDKLRRPIDRPTGVTAAWVLRRLSSRMPAPRPRLEIPRGRLPSSPWKNAGGAGLGRCSRNATRRYLADRPPLVARVHF